MNDTSEGNLAIPHDFGVLPSDVDVARTDRIDNSQAWWGVFTRPEREIELAQYLQANQISTFLPMVPTTRLGGNSSGWFPLFPGYLFVFGDEAAHLTALATGCVCRILPVADQARLRSDLANLQRMLMSDIPLRLETNTTGLACESVHVARGELAGLSGAAYQNGSESRFMVDIDFLGQGVSAPLDLVLPRQSAG